MDAQKDPPPPKPSWLGRSVLVGAVAGAVGLGVPGLVLKLGPEFHPCSGAVYGFFLGAVFGVLADRARRN